MIEWNDTAEAWDKILCDALSEAAQPFHQGVARKALAQRLAELEAGIAATAHEEDERDAVALEHETVGQRFRAYGGEFLCARWVRSQGFWMRCTKATPPASILRYEIDQETCISGRAIGKSFHRIYDDSPAAPHEMPCECRICQP